MNLVTECPKIPDNWKGGVTEVCKLLGLDRSTIRKAALRGKSFGGLDWTLGKNGRKQFTGKEIKRFWKSY